MDWRVSIFYVVDVLALAWPPLASEIPRRGQNPKAKLAGHAMAFIGAWCEVRL
jgi:hypothetical protein